jgi:hypothetical protein
VNKLVALENFSLFDNKMRRYHSLTLERVNKVKKEMNISYNGFNGNVEKNVALLDTLNMTMFNDKENTLQYY